MTKYFVVTIAALFLLSCEKVDEEALRIQERNKVKQMDCMDYDYSHDSLRVSNFFRRDSAGKKSLYYGYHDNNLLTGVLYFKEDSCFLSFIALFGDTSDTTRLLIKGTYTSELDSIQEYDFWDSEVKHYRQFNKLNFYSAEFPDSTLLDVVHRVDCGVIPSPPHRIKYYKGNTEYEVLFGNF